MSIEWGGKLVGSSVGGGGRTGGSSVGGTPTGTASSASVGSTGGATSPTGDGSTVEAQYGDLPLGRFGHTTTHVGQATVILFGGAVGDSGKYQITNDLCTLDVTVMKWSAVKAGNSPAPRAAHAAACVDVMQFVIYGGATGGGSLSSDELYLLDLRKQPGQLTWMTVPITGATPGRRYGHTMVYHKPNLVVFGGNDGQKSVNDIWFMDVEKSPFCWHNVYMAPNAKQPLPRVYHTADICREGPAAGMVVVFGGRTTDSRSLRDIWGLRQHRDGRWDWIEAPTRKGMPTDARFQHTALFVGSKMLILGGRDGEMARALPTALYDTEACEWRHLTSMGRFRHSSWRYEHLVFTFGGFDHRTQSHPTSDLQSLDVFSHKNFFNDKEREMMARRVSPGGSTSGTASAAAIPATVSHQQQSPHLDGLSSMRSSSALAGRPSSRSALTRSAERVRLSGRVHTKIDSPHNPDFSALVRKISIDRLEEEGKKIKCYVNASIQPVVEGEESAVDRIIRRLLRPNIMPFMLEREFNSQLPFCLPWDDVAALCASVLRVMTREESVIHLRAPIKVYGDLHGQYYDMMRLFGSYKSPVNEDWADDNEQEMGSQEDIQGDIDSIDYLFLGDFVDRGTNSLEVICLLFALKVRYPQQVHLIRGNHEDPAINSIYGFKEECKRRLREDPDHSDSCWEKFNKVFEWLPVAAVIEDRILCIHGGIGGSIHELQHLVDMQRPLKVSQVPSNELEQRVTDLLWSDPTDNDSMRGVVANDTRDPDGSGHIVKFGPDRVATFLTNNKLDLIIRAHECVMDGFERFAGGKLITLFSATDYCGHHKNAGALLFIRRDLTVVPKIIYPPDRVDTLGIRSTWINLESRPPTPLRSVRRIRDNDLGF
eukprot:Lankesteria_metandrocarpae@DN5282_c0_g1_i1.p1